MPERADSLRDLIFVMFALRTGQIEREALFSSFLAWDPASGGSLMDVLLSRGALNPSLVSRLDRMVSDYLRDRGGGLEGTLPTIGVGGTIATGATIEGPASLEGAGLIGSGGTLPESGRTLASADEAGSDSFTLTPPTSGSSRRFQVIARHAEGGLGVVDLALDTELNREVALKRIKDRHADNPVSRSRFLLEAEVTGGLEHPGVVPVYGLGTAEDGRPYYAMRFIRGESLQTVIAAFHADPSARLDPSAHRLELRKLLARLLDVCNTIDYAHGQGILHRDIKPANIMVGPYGETLVVDWGIAKAVGRPDQDGVGDGKPRRLASASGATQTLQGSAIGTPAFMSPEQAAGDLDKLGPPSDVYSLGATLYQILTGRPPFEDDDIRRVLRAVERGEFPAPRKQDRTIAPALEAICLKAMATRPADRYPSARALAEDIERWMADEPVSAYPDPFSERARRWMRQRRTAVTAAGASLLVAVAGLVVVLGVQQTANTNLRAANVRERQRFDLAMEAVRTFHTGVSEDLLLGQKEYVDLRKKLLIGARDFYGRFRALLEGGSDAPSQEALGRAYFDLGEVTSKIGTPDEALAAHRQGLEIREKLAALPDATPATRANVARSLIAIAQVEQSTKQLVQAESLFQRARGILQALADAGADVDTERLLAKCDLALGTILAGKGQTPDAIAAYTRGVGRLRRLSVVQPGDLLVRADLAAGGNLTARLLLRNNRTAEAEEYLSGARAIREELARIDPGDTAAQSNLARTYHAFGLLYSTTRQPLKALEIYSKERAILEDLVRRFAAVSMFQSDLAAVCHDMASDLYRTGRTDEALASFERSRAIKRELVRANPTVVSHRRNLALTDIALGKIFSESGRSGDALEAYAQARENLQEVVKESPSVTAYRSELAATDFHLGRLLGDNGRPVEALAALERGRALLRGLLAGNPEDNPSRLDLADNLAASAMLLVGRGRLDEALAALEDARAIQAALLKADPSSRRSQEGLADSDDMSCSVLGKLGRWSEGEAAHLQARRRWEGLGKLHPADANIQRGLGRTFQTLGELRAEEGRWDEAVEADLRALEVLRPLAGSNPSASRIQSALARVERDLGVAFRSLGRLAEAAEAFRQSALVLERLPRLGAGQFHSLAAARALLAGLGGRPGSSVSTAEAAAESDLALAALRQAIAEGYRDLDGAAADRDLDALRNRPEFQLLLLDLAMPLDVFAP